MYESSFPGYASIGVALLAVAFSMFNYLLPLVGPTESLGSGLLKFFPVLIVLAMAAALLGAFAYVVFALKGYDLGRKRLVILEEYRFDHKSLPEGVTISSMINRKSKLEALLKESEPSEQGKASARGSEGILTGFWSRKGTARAFFGLIFILAGFIVASFIPVLNMQTNSVRFTIYIGFAISLFTSGMVLFAEGALEHWSV
jgi:hypothetical protein